MTEKTPLGDETKAPEQQAADIPEIASEFLFPIKSVADNSVRRRIDGLTPYEGNSRTHSDEQVAQLAAAMREWGFTSPILIDEAGLIIAGHGRLLAARSIGMEDVPCIVAEGWTEDQKRAYNIADNKLALNAGWDLDKLALEMGDLWGNGFALQLTGFGVDEIHKIILPKVVDKKGDAEACPELPSTPISIIGDVWTMGDHRLICGDATMDGTIQTLLSGETIDMVFTDPPYNIDYEGVNDKGRKIKNDKMSDDAFVDFLTSALQPCDTMYVCCSWQYSHLFRKALDIIGCKPKAMIIWDKINPAQHLDLYFKQHEIIFYHGAFGGEKTMRGDVWQVKRQKNTVHPTMKPVELISLAFESHPDKRIVFDAFGGSGSTLIACEKHGKACRMVELDPAYVDVIVRRWQEYTGREAVHADGRTFGEIENGRA